MDVSTVIAIVLFIFQILFLTVGYLMKRQFDDLTRRVDRHEAEIKELREDYIRRFDDIKTMLHQQELLMTRIDGNIRLIDHKLKDVAHPGRNDD